MGRILAIDYGTKRVGLAVTDAEQIIASPLDTVHSSELMTFLKHYIDRENVKCIVIGEPKRHSGEPSNVEQEIVGLIRKLKKEFQDIAIERHDERFTSLLAKKAIFSAGASKKQRREKGLVDRVSATLILQSYLDQIK